MKTKFETSGNVEMLVKCGHCEIVEDPVEQKASYDNKFKLNLSALQDFIPSTVTSKPLSG